MPDRRLLLGGLAVVAGSAARPGRDRANAATGPRPGAAYRTLTPGHYRRVG